MHILKRCAQIGTVSLMFSCGLAMAGPYTYTTVTTEIDYFGQGGVGTPYTDLEYLAVPFFTGPGTLTGVNIALTATLGQNNDITYSMPGNSPVTDISGYGSNSEFYVYNATADGTVTETANVQVYLMDSGGVVAPGGTPCLNTIGSAGAETAPAASGCFIGELPAISYSTTVSVGPGDDMSYPTTDTNVINGLSTSGTLSDSNFSEFTSATPGTVYLPLYIEGSSSVTPNLGLIDSVVTLNAGVTATITYTSEDLSAPEPASMVLMSFALTAVGVMRRRRSRS